MLRRSSLTFAALLLFSAGWWRASAATYYGCYICKPVAPVGTGATCRHVSDSQTGDGWKCEEINDLPWPDGPLCSVEGGPCYNVDGGGGGGGGGTGGGETCQTTSFCPAECFSCSGGAGRPAV
jgi:hypothetical protein